MTTACAMTDISVLQHKFGPRHAIQSLKKMPSIYRKNHQKISWRIGKVNITITEDPFPVPTGWPQRSLLSTFSRNIIINDIVRLLSDHSISGWALAYDNKDNKDKQFYTLMCLKFFLLKQTWSKINNLGEKFCNNLSCFFLPPITPVLLSGN
jgi:hypothetical protein